MSDYSDSYASHSGGDRNGRGGGRGRGNGGGRGRGRGSFNNRGGGGRGGGGNGGRFINNNEDGGYKSNSYGSRDGSGGGRGRGRGFGDRGGRGRGGGQRNGDYNSRDNWNNDDKYKKKSWDNNYKNDNEYNNGKNNNNNEQQGDLFYTDKSGKKDSWGTNSNKFANNNGRNFANQYSNQPNYYNQGDEEEEHVEESTSATKKKDEKDTIEADPATREYFERIRSTLKEVEDPEEKSIMIDNALRELGEKAGTTLCDKSCSLVFENLIKSFTNTQRVQLLSNIEKDFMMVAGNCNGSRLLETILAYTPAILNDNDKENIAVLSDNLFKLVDVLIENIHLVINDRYSSYVLSSVIFLLSGRIKEKKPPTKYQKSNNVVQEETQTVIYEVPTKFGEELKKTLQTIFDKLKDKMGVMVYDNSYSLNVLKTLFQVSTENHSFFTKLSDKILCPTEDYGTEEEKLISLSYNQFGSILCETIIETSPDSVYSKLFSLLRKNLLKLSAHAYANHVIQKLVDNVRGAPHVKTLVQDIKEPDVCKQFFDQGRGHIVQKIIEGCIKYDTQQKEIIKILSAAVIPENQNNYTDLVKNLLVLNNNISRRHNFSTSGALIVQNLFNFNTNFNSMVVESFLKMDIGHIKILINDLIGSRVVDGFLESKVELSKKQQLIKSLKGSFVEIAMDKYGSYVIEKIYNISDMATREMICEELAAQEQLVFSKPCGRYVLLVCKVNIYKKKKTAWSSQQETKDKKRKMFDDIINDDGSKLPKPKNQNNKRKNQDEEQEDYGQQQEEEEIKPKQQEIKKQKIKQEPTYQDDYMEKGDDFDEIDEIFSSKKSNNQKSNNNNNKNKKKK